MSNGVASPFKQTLDMTCIFEQNCTSQHLFCMCVLPSLQWQQPDRTVLCYLYLALVDKGEFQSVSVAAQIIGTFLRKGRENRERETEAERGRWRERRAQRVPRSLLVMRGCRGAVAAPNYYQAAATAGSKGPAGPQHKPSVERNTSVERNRERKKGEAIVAPLHPSHPLLPVAATLTG